MNNISFYAHHSAFGAFASFMMGKTGMGGGFVLSNVKPPQGNMFIGYKQDDLINLLPFCNFADKKSEEEAFTGEDTGAKDEKNIRLFADSEITREMGWASDKWTAGNFSFSLITPFGEVKEPSSMTEEEKKFALAPVIFAQITLDNRGKASDAEMIFGFEGLRRRISETTKGKLLGAAFERKFGFAAIREAKISEFSGLDLLTCWADGNYQNSGLGMAPSLLFKVPAGEAVTYTFALATYQDGAITAGVKTSFYYTSVFESLEEVLAYALDNSDAYLSLAAKRENELKSSGLNEHRQFLLSHAAHSYHASSQLMRKEDGTPLWIVNEGEYLMMNTFDLTVDHLFWELRFHPWTIANSLDLFAERYSYKDHAGVSFTHDMGVENGFSPVGYSSYEVPNLDGCFSYMTHEELLNWILSGTVYSLNQIDNAWLEKNIGVFEACMDSLVARDTNNDGIMDIDSSRCESGAEITTYDSLDVSLGQARNNLYMGVKTWAAYVLIAEIFKVHADEKRSAKAIDKAKQAAHTIISNYNKEEGYIPAVFEKGNTSRIIPAIEALIYPYFAGFVEYTSENGPFADLIATLKLHIATILRPGICLDEVSKGWKLSSTSKNTWNSKIFLCQYVIKEILGFDFGEKEDEWDKVHAYWQQVPCSMDGATDQVNSDSGSSRGSRLYPRLVTSILWMK
jgi:xylan 1,4-beta-xylosidase